MKRSQRLCGNIRRDRAPLHLRKVSDALQKAVRDTRCPARATSDLLCPAVLDLDLQDVRCTGNDLFQLLRFIELHMIRDEESVTQRRGERTCPRCRADQREMSKIDANRAGASPLPHDNIQRKVFHRRVQDFFDISIQSMDLIDEKYIVVLQCRQDGSQLPRTPDGRTARHLKLRSQLIGDDLRHGGLAESRRSIEQHMIQRLFARLRCLDVHLEILLEGFLSDIIVQMLRAKRRLPLVFCAFFGGNDAPLAAEHLFLFTAKAFDVFVLHEDSFEKGLRKSIP